METQKTLDSQSHLEKERTRGINRPDCRLYYRPQSSRLYSECWLKGRNTDHWTKTERPEMNPHTYGHLIFDKGGKNKQ